MQINRSTNIVTLPIALAAGLAFSHAAMAQAGWSTTVWSQVFRASLGRTSGHAAIIAGQRNFSSSASGSQGYLGIVFRDVTDERAAALKLKEPQGAEIIHVDHDGPAGKAGLREHDVILQMNGQAIEGEEQLRRIFRETPPGRSVTILLGRDGQLLTVSTQMADRNTVEREAWEQRTTVPEPTGSGAFRGNGFFSRAPSAAPPITAPPDPPTHSIMNAIMLGSSYTGAALELIGPQLAQFFGSQGGNGLLVRSVDPNSPAATAGLRAGDVVVRANAIIIAGLSDWSRLVRENKGRPVSVVVVRDKQEQTLVLVPDSKKRSSMDFEPSRDPNPNDRAREQDCPFLWMN